MMNKINKDEIKNLLVLSQKYNASLTLSYIPESSLYSTKELYGLYYSGWYKIEISEYCRLPGCYIKISDNLDEVTDTIYKCLSDSIGKEILQALKNLGFEAEKLKYFDRDAETYEKFKAEVLKLKKG